MLGGKQRIMTNLKVVVAKASLNSSNIFNLRKTPDVVRELVFRSVEKSYNNTYDERNMVYAIQKLKLSEYNLINVDKDRVNDIILARLIKYRKNNESEHWDNRGKKIVLEIDENSIIEKIHFLYEKNSEYFFIEERSKLDCEKSIGILKYLINYNNMEAAIDINTIKNNKEVKKRIKELKKITVAHFELIPNNPDQKLWRYFENAATKFCSTLSKYEFKNDDGLNYTKELDEAVDDVNDGKSRKYIIAGYNSQKKYDEIRSHDFTRRKFVKVDSSDEGRINGIWQVLKEILNI